MPFSFRPALSLLLTVFPVVLIIAWGLGQQIELAQFIPALLALTCYLGLYAFLLINEPPARVKQFLAVKKAGFALISLLMLLLPYLLFALGTQTFHFWSLGKLSLYLSLPLLLSLGVPASKQGSWTLWDIGIILAIWLPFDYRLLSHIWLWPQGEAAYPINTLCAINLAMIIFLVRRGMNKSGLPLNFRKAHLKPTLISTLLFMAIAIPYGLWSGFIGWNPEGDILKLLATPIGYFLFVAFPEEFLFRGLILTYLLSKNPNKYFALLVSSLVFGLSHLNNPPLNDLHYLILATIAGLFYGYTFLKTKNLLVPTLVHTTVDSIWVCFFLLPSS